MIRILLYGLLAGVLLSLLRAPLGLDWIQLPAVDATTASLFRAGALVAVALCLDPRRTAFRRGAAPAMLALSVAAGLALDGLVLAGLWRPTGRLGYALTLVAGTLLLRAVAGRATAVEEDEGAEQPPLPERLGLVLAGAGAAIAIENLAHHARLLTLGLPADDIVVGVTWLLVVALGSLAFGRFVSGPAWRRIVPPLGATVAAALTLAGLVFVAGMGPDPIYLFLRRFELDTSRIGSLGATALLSAGCFVAPGFAAGTALPRGAARLATLLLGAAVGVILHPVVVGSVGRPLAFPAEEHVPWAWAVLVGGTAVAAAGAFLAIATAERGRRRIAGLALTLLALALPFGRARLPVWSFSPWYVVPIQPLLVAPTPEGVVTVEIAGGTSLFVTLDRRRVSPVASEEEADRRRLAYAWSLLDPAVAAERSPRVLLVGQMTPARARALGALGTMELERTAPWFDALEAIDGVLFPPGAPVPGELVRPEVARGRIAAGNYDLVLVPPVHGPVLMPKSPTTVAWGTVAAPSPGSLDVPDGTLAVAWCDAAAPLASADLGPQVLVAMDRFQHVALGAVRGNLTPIEEVRPTALLPAGHATTSPLPAQVMATFPAHRPFGLRRAAFERLGEAAAGTPREPLARSLALHFAAQRPSSPYENDAQRIELDEDELRALFAAAGDSGGLDAFSRDLWEDYAWLLTDKRMPDLALVYLEPVAERFGPWPTLDRAVGQAYLELLEAAEALRILERVLEAEPLDLRSRVACAEAARETGDPARAAFHYRRALEVQPGRHDLERGLGIALLEADDPEGRALLERLLATEPEDSEIQRALSIGTALPPWNR